MKSNTSESAPNRIYCTERCKHELHLPQSDLGLSHRNLGHHTKLFRVKMTNMLPTLHSFPLNWSILFLRCQPPEWLQSMPSSTKKILRHMSWHQPMTEDAWSHVITIFLTTSAVLEWNFPCVSIIFTFMCMGSHVLHVCLCEACQLNPIKHDQGLWQDAMKWNKKVELEVFNPQFHFSTFWVIHLSKGLVKKWQCTASNADPFLVRHESYRIHTTVCLLINLTLLHAPWLMKLSPTQFRE